MLKIKMKKKNENLISYLTNIIIRKITKKNYYDMEVFYLKQFYKFLF